MENGRRRQARVPVSSQGYSSGQPQPTSQPVSSLSGDQQLPIVACEAPGFLPASTEEGQFSYNYAGSGYLHEHGFQHQQYAPHLYQMPGFYGEEGRPQQQQVETYAPENVVVGGGGGGGVASSPHPPQYHQQLPYGHLSHFQQRHPNITPILPSQRQVAQPQTRPSQRTRQRSFDEPGSSSSYRTGPRFPISYQQIIPSITSSTYTDTGFQEFVESMPEPQTEDTDPPDPIAALRQRHQTLMRQTFESITSDNLVGASVALRELSDSLLPRVEELGLAYDDYSQQEQRLQFWRNFNYCWLGLLQKQLDFGQEALDKGRSALTVPLIDLKTLREMGDLLVKHCDEIDQFALVDYEQGVWEDEIIQILIQCVKIAVELENEESFPQSTGGAQETAASGEAGRLINQDTPTTTAAG